jgi:predicted DNA-binding protein with PD1-like motif
MSDKWESDASHEAEYHSVKARYGEVYILRLNTGADVYKAIQQFAKDKKIRFAKIHAAFMGGFEPIKLLVWAPDKQDPENWHNESIYTVHNQSMLLSMSGMIHLRKVNGEEEPFPAIHVVVGGGWNVPTVGGHLAEGTIVKGVLQVFITEILGINVLYPSIILKDPLAHGAPENWYKEVK